MKCRRCKIKRLLKHIVERLERIEMNSERTITMAQQITDAIARLDAATTAVGVTLADLRNQLANGTPGDDPVVLAALDRAVSRLTALAHDPANPVPVEPPIV